MDVSDPSIGSMPRWSDDQRIEVRDMSSCQANSLATLLPLGPVAFDKVDFPERTPCSIIKAQGAIYKARRMRRITTDHSQHCCIVYPLYDFACHRSLRLPHLRNSSPLDADHHTPNDHSPLRMIRPQSYFTPRDT
jgi:hypothetical protein